jgi:hypothetical protein
MGPKGKKRWLSNEQVIQANEARTSGVKHAGEVLRTKLSKKDKEKLGAASLGGYLQRFAGKNVSFSQANAIRDRIEAVTGIGRGQLAGITTTFDNQKKTVHFRFSKIASRQAAVAEIAASRKPRRKPSTKKR